MESSLEMIKVLFYLVIVIALFFVVIKFFRNKNLLSNQTSHLTVIERYYLSRDKVLYLVKVVDEVWLVSATKDNLDFIKRVDLSVDIEPETELLNFLKKGQDDEVNEE